MAFNVVLQLRNSYGEVDWILPVLFELKKQRPDTKILTLFSSDNFYAQGESYPRLMQLLREISTAIVHPQELVGELTEWSTSKAHPGEYIVVPKQPRISPELATTIARIQALGSQAESRLHAAIQDLYLMQSKALEKRYVKAILDTVLPRVFESEPVHLILRDRGADFRMFRSLLDQLGSSPVVRFPHGTMPQKYNAILAENAAKASQARPDRTDLMLLASPDDARIDAHFSHLQNPHTLVGYPRYDDFWIQKLLESTPTKTVTGKGVPIQVLLISRGADFYLPEEEHTRLMEIIQRFVSAHAEVVLSIKPHPREELHVLQHILNGLNPDRYQICRASMLEACVNADFVLSFWSSGMIDALALGKPVVEIFRFPKNALRDNGAPIPAAFTLDAQGIPTSAMRELGLAAPAETLDDVEQLYGEWRQNQNLSTLPTWVKAQKIAFENLHPPGAEHAKLAVAALLQVSLASENLA